VFTVDATGISTAPAFHLVFDRFHQQHWKRHRGGVYRYCARHPGRQHKLRDRNRDARHPFELQAGTQASSALSLLSSAVGAGATVEDGSLSAPRPGLCRGHGVWSVYRPRRGLRRGDQFVQQRRTRAWAATRSTRASASPRTRTPGPTSTRPTWSTASSQVRDPMTPKTFLHLLGAREVFGVFGGSGSLRRARPLPLTC